MLAELEIRNLGPIRAANVGFSPGMTAITGETGAGKSMLLNALSLVRGGPAESAKVTQGESETWAQAVFEAKGSSPAVQAALEAGADVVDGELFLARQVPNGGRSKAILGGHTVPRTLLGEISDNLITVHGQSDQLRLVSSARQRDFLDAFAGNSAEREEYAVAWARLSDLTKRLERLTSQQAQARQQADYLRESIELIERVDPQPNEDDELKAQRERIENSAAIMEAVGGALGALDASQLPSDSGDSPSVVSLLSQARASLQAVSHMSEFGAMTGLLDDAEEKVTELVYQLSAQLDGLDGSEADLDELNSRIHDLSELTRRWGPRIEDVRTWLEKAHFELEDIDASPEKLEELRAAQTKAQVRARKAADALHASRSVAAHKLAQQVTSELEALAMSGAQLSVSVTSRQGSDALTPSGGDDVAFDFSAYPGAPLQPLGKSASGGELSRLMLALELSLAKSRGGKESEESEFTFVFDEVDAGVGGEAAVELGRRLATLAQSSQVIVVTHLAQVASWADAQFVVEKQSGTDVETTVTKVEGESRIEEIARMLSGSDSQTSLTHARELLATSRLDTTA